MSDDWFTTAYEQGNIAALATQCGFDLTYGEAECLLKESNGDANEFKRIWTNEAWWRE